MGRIMKRKEMRLSVRLTENTGSSVKRMLSMTVISSFSSLTHQRIQRRRRVQCSVADKTVWEFNKTVFRVINCSACFTFEFETLTYKIKKRLQKTRFQKKLTTSFTYFFL